MKYLNNDEMTISTKRTLKNLRQALTQLLKIKPLEKISIQELCDMAMISRGTFYNYFEDKYDLLKYDWTQVQLEIDPAFSDDDLKVDDYKKYMNLLLRNIINYLSKEKELYQNIMVLNADSIFSENMHDYIEGQILLKLKQAMHYEKKSKIPIELLSTIYANTIIIVGKWWLEHGENYAQEDVYKFFEILVE